jgi:hypothetical protein
MNVKAQITHAKINPRQFRATILFFVRVSAKVDRLIASDLNARNIVAAALPTGVLM